MDNKKQNKLQITNEGKSLDQLTFDEKSIQLIKDTIAVGATDNELQLFLYHSKRTGLDPLARQIFFIKRGDKVNIQTSIDGFRIIAERHGDYAGQDEPEFITDNSDKLKVAKVRVYKWHGDQRYVAATGVAHMEEYLPTTGSFMWTKMPHTMLAKVAEALALRKAFPHDLSGIYSDDEMAQANANSVAQKKTYPKITTQKAKILSDLFALKGKEQAEVLKFFKIKTLEDLNTQQANALMNRLHSFPDKDQVMEEHIADGEYVDPDEVDVALNTKDEENA